MATAENNRHQKDSGDHRSNPRKGNAEPARKAPGTERGLTHSPYFNGPAFAEFSLFSFQQSQQRNNAETDY